MKLRIEKAIYGGAGLARVADPSDKLAGKAIFVPFTLPDEVVEAAVSQDKRSYALADLQNILEPSAERVEPECEYFGRCGGCHYQHAGNTAQLTMKRSILIETLRRARIADIPEIEVLGAAPWGYRNRIRLVVSGLPTPGLGYREQKSHAMVTVTHCPVAAPLLQRAINSMTQLGSGLADLCNEVEFFTNGEQSTLVMTLWTSRVGQAGKGLNAELEKVCERLSPSLPELKGAVMVAASNEGDDEVGVNLVAEWGQLWLLYRAAGVDYRVSTRSFFQVNRFLVDGLVKNVTQSRTGLLAWDLYAGVGLFARALTASFSQVIAVESAPSYEDLKHNLAGTCGRAVHATARNFLLQQVRAKTAPPDLIVVDPPRSGLGTEVCELLGKTQAREIVYVSCDPTTMSRDLGPLLQSGLILQSLTLVDLFPQTFHMETVAVLARR